MHPCTHVFLKKKIQQKPDRISLGKKALATKPEDLSSVSETHVIKRGEMTLRLCSDLPKRSVPHTLLSLSLS